MMDGIRNTSLRSKPCLSDARRLGKDCQAILDTARASKFEMGRPYRVIGQDGASNYDLLLSARLLTLHNNKYIN